MGSYRWKNNMYAIVIGRGLKDANFKEICVEFMHKVHILIEVRVYLKKGLGHKYFNKNCRLIKKYWLRIAYY